MQEDAACRLDEVVVVGDMEQWKAERFFQWAITYSFSEAIRLNP